MQSVPSNRPPYSGNAFENTRPEDAWPDNASPPYSATPDPAPPMRASQFFISTLKEAPADADVVSQQLMLRAGMIKKLAAGIYTYMPLGLRAIRKIEAIIRDEMNRAGAIELLMPVVQPAE